MVHILQRKHYDFDSIENFIRCKGYPESNSGRGEKSNFMRGTYPEIGFFVQYASQIEGCDDGICKVQAKVG